MRQLLMLVAAVILFDCPALTIHRSFRPRGFRFGGGAGAVVPVESRIAAAIDEGRAKAAQRPRVYIGRVTSVTSGDEFCLVTGGGTRVPVRLDRVDAPELGQAYGQESADYLKKLLYGREVRVQYTKRDQRGRVIGLVTLNKKDVNLRLVADGMAWYCGLPDQTPGYAEADASARKDKKGLWAGENPTNPAQWREEASKREALGENVRKQETIPR